MHQPLPRAEVHRRQELLRGVVSPLRSWTSIYLKIWREAPYGLDLGHMLKTKLGSSCRQHVTPLRKAAVGKAGSRKRRAILPPTADADACANACESPLVLEPSQDSALDSPRVLPAPGGDDLGVFDAEGALDVWDAFLWH